MYIPPPTQLQQQVQRGLSLSATHLQSIHHCTTAILDTRRRLWGPNAVSALAVGGVFSLSAPAEEEDGKIWWYGRTGI